MQQASDQYRPVLEFDVTAWVRIRVGDVVAGRARTPMPATFRLSGLRCHPGFQSP